MHTKNWFILLFVSCTALGLFRGGLLVLTPEAEHILRQAIRHDPNAPQTHFNFAILLFRRVFGDK